MFLNVTMPNYLSHHRLQEQLRRIKRNEEKDKLAPPLPSKKKKKESAIIKVRVRHLIILFLIINTVSDY